MADRKAIHEYHEGYNKAYGIIEKAMTEALPEKLEEIDCYKRIIYGFVANKAKHHKEYVERMGERLKKLSAANAPQIILDCEERIKCEHIARKEAFEDTAKMILAVAECEKADILPQDLNHAIADYLSRGCWNCVYRDSKPGDFGTACYCKLGVKDEVQTETYVIGNEDGTTEEISAEEAVKRGLDKRSVYESGREYTMFNHPCEQYRRMQFPGFMAEDIHKWDKSGSGKWVKFIEEHYCAKCPDKTFCGTEPGGDWDPNAKWNCITDKIQIELVKSDEAHNDTPEKRLLKAIFGEKKTND